MRNSIRFDCGGLTPAHARTQAAEWAERHTDADSTDQVAVDHRVMKASEYHPVTREPVWWEAEFYAHIVEPGDPGYQTISSGDGGDS